MSPSLESSASQDLWSVMSGIVPQSVASSKPCALSLEIFTRGSVVWGNLLVSGVSLGVRLVRGGASGIKTWLMPGYQGGIIRFCMSPNIRYWEGGSPLGIGGTRGSRRGY